MKGILLDEHNDIQVVNGTAVIGDSLYQNQGLLLMLHKGELKEHPLLGVGIESYLNDDADGGELMRDIRTQLESDGMTVSSVSFEDTKLNIDASYE